MRAACCAEERRALVDAAPVSPTRIAVIAGLIHGCPLLLAVVFALACTPLAADAGDTTTIPGGSFTMGSSLHDRAEATDAAARHGADLRDVAARLRDELPERTRSVPSFAIMVHPVTQADYAQYVYVRGVAEPWVDAGTWSRTPHRDGEDPERVAWHRGRPQIERMDHPAVLVSHIEAEAYCDWWGEQRGGIGALPTEAQWERAARGDDGRAWPWGGTFVAQRGNTRESGFGDMVPVATLAASPHGVHDVGGNVAEWTFGVQDGEAIVKGASWRDDLVAARPAARRSFPAAVRHVAIGFRCVLEQPARRRAGAKLDR